MIRWKRITSLLVYSALLALLHLAGPAAVSAHAELSGSNPAAGSALSAFPEQIELTFSETVDPQLSTILLKAADGSRVELGDVAVEPRDAHFLLAPITAPASANGVFTVVWGAHSAEDGHAASGSFTFSVGTGEAPAQVSSGTSAASSWAVAARWLELIGLVFLAGLGIFSSTAAVGNRVPTATTMMTLSGIGLLGAVISFWARDAAISGSGMFGKPDLATIVDLLDSTYGRAWIVRVAVLTFALAIAAIIRRSSSRGLTWMIAVCGFTGLGTIAISGHGAAVEHSSLAIAVDWLHMSAAAIWLGGLLGLLLVLSPSAIERGERELLRRQGNRFAAAVMLIVTAGIASAWWHIEGRRSLQQTDYGQSLLIKIALGGGLLGVAFYNRRVLQSDRSRSDLIPFAIGVELILATIVVLFSADLSQTPPATQPFPVQVAARAIELDQTATSGASTVALSGILTGDPADRITIDVTPAEELQRIIVRTQLEKPEAGEPIGDRFDATALEGREGSFIFPSGRLGIAGPWNLEISIRRAGVADDVVSIPVDTSGLSARGTRSVTDEWGGFRMTGHTALALVLAAAMLAIGLGGLRRITGLEPLASGFLLAASLLIAGGFIVSAARSMLPVTPDHAISDPHDSSAGALTYAGELYRLNCAVCHGANGQGAGNVDAAHLHGSSANLTQTNTVGQSDGDLRYWIAHGVAGTRMPAFDAALTDEELWQLVQLVREFQDDARQQAKEE